MFVVGCTKKEEAKSVSQVAARVNADEITVSQVNNVLSRAQGLTPESATKAKSEILEKLIEQQLAKQQAIATKLDRTPAVVQAIEASRNEILARAYLEKIAAALPKPSVDDAKKYYMAHPELFAQRRVFSLEELIIEPKEGIGGVLTEQVEESRTLQEVAAWLQSNNIKFSANRGVRAAEALPLELLPKLQALKDGEMQLVETGEGRRSLFHVVASQTMPVDEATAMPRIQQFLFNQNVTKAIAVEMKSLRDKSDIAYQGEFVGGLAAAEAKAKAEADAKAKEQERTKSEADEQAKAKAEVKAKADAESQSRAEAVAKARLDADARRDAKAKVPSSGAAQLRQENIDNAFGGQK
jgi:EpsD family peptidyl-prolyl cis-trans isomerase